jgi:hypothetical protein
MIDPAAGTNKYLQRLSELLRNDLEHQAGHAPPATTLSASIKNALGVTDTIPQDDTPPPARPIKRYKPGVAT